MDWQWGQFTIEAQGIVLVKFTLYVLTRCNHGAKIQFFFQLCKFFHFYLRISIFFCIFARLFDNENENEDENMQLLTSKLPVQTRQMVRFVIVGTSGTGLQYALYYIFLKLAEYLLPGIELVTACFTVAYVLEVITNYFLTSIYTFETRPSLKNAGGFATGRVFNYLVQIGLLQLCLLWMSDEMAGIVAIVLAGIINYFVLKFFFKK